MYVVLVLTNLIFNYTFSCCLAGLGVGRERENQTAVCLVIRRDSQFIWVSSDGPESWGCGEVASSCYY